ncbi:Gigasin-3a [Scenedesmus sp. PABB004]|nr:Gigasin-3a [Scenedesmus sp. PABB004]
MTRIIVVALMAIALAACARAAPASVTELSLIGFIDGSGGITTGTEQASVTLDAERRVAYLVGGDQLYAVGVDIGAGELAAPAPGGRALPLLFAQTLPATITDVSLCGDFVAVATEGPTKTAPGVVHLLGRYAAGATALPVVTTFTVGARRRPARRAPRRAAQHGAALKAPPGRAHGPAAPRRPGALPDQIQWSRACDLLVSANEGEPDGYGAGFTDPEVGARARSLPRPAPPGPAAAPPTAHRPPPPAATTAPRDQGSVSIISLTYCAEGKAEACGGGRVAGTVRTATFGAWNDRRDLLVKRGVKLNGPGASVAQDLEPEFATFSADERTIFEANAIAVVDVARAEVVNILGLGMKNHSAPGNALDTSDKDGAVNIKPWPLLGLYQPDEIAAFSDGGREFIVTANEGDARDWDGFAEEERVADIADKLDATAFPNAAELAAEAALGRINVVGVPGELNDANGDGKFDRLVSFGARSFSVFQVMRAGKSGVASLKRVFDSRSQLEELSAARLPALFNSDGTAEAFDSRSDNKGPEPEGLALGTADHPAGLATRRCLFLTTERLSAVFVVDLTTPERPRFNSLAMPPAGADGALRLRGPEGITYARYPVSAKVSVPLVLVAYEAEGASGMAVFLVQNRKKAGGN